MTNVIIPLRFHSFSIAHILHCFRASMLQVRSRHLLLRLAAMTLAAVTSLAARTTHVLLRDARTAQTAWNVCFFLGKSCPPMLLDTQLNPVSSSDSIPIAAVNLKQK